MAIRCEIYCYKADSFDKIYCILLVLRLLCIKMLHKKTCIDNHIIVYFVHNDRVIGVHLLS